ncbi:SANT/Myb domain protein [Nannochloropsis gaditana]|uniref:SANT/Myb domain protein n=1 Tax=Nannochloropsis gaditana TaxID=72520 RepID=W7TQ96_9STRA|nr:SANT/Myb domain protein [Nannochloropsis gaditana]
MVACAGELEGCCDSLSASEYLTEDKIHDAGDEETPRPNVYYYDAHFLLHSAETLVSVVARAADGTAGHIGNKRRGRRTCSKPKTHNGRWTNEEHVLFLQGLDAHGKDWKQIHKKLTTRSLGQIRSHAQKYFQKVEQAKRSGRLGDGDFQLLMDGKRMVFSRGGRRPTASDLEGDHLHQDEESSLAEHQTDGSFDGLPQNMHNPVPFLEPHYRHQQQQHQYPNHWQQQQCPSSPSSTCCTPRGGVWRTMAGKGWLPDTCPVSSIEEEIDAVVKSELEHVGVSWGGREGGAREERNEDEVEDALAMDFLRATSHLFPLEELRSFVTGVASDVGSHREDGTCPAPHAMAMDELVGHSPGPTVPAGCCTGNNGNVQGANWAWTGTGASVPADTDPLTVGPLMSSCAVASDDASHRGKSESFLRPFKSGCWVKVSSLVVGRNTNRRDATDLNRTFK